jgi:hypothetical protein
MYSLTPPRRRASPGRARRERGGAVSKAALPTLPHACTERGSTSPDWLRAASRAKALSWLSLAWMGRRGRDRDRRRHPGRLDYADRLRHRLGDRGLREPRDRLALHGPSSPLSSRRGVGAEVPPCSSSCSRPTSPSRPSSTSSPAIAQTSACSAWLKSVGPLKLIPGPPSSTSRRQHPIRGGRRLHGDSRPDWAVAKLPLQRRVGPAQQQGHLRRPGGDDRREPPG